MIASEVTNDHIAELERDILAGRLGKASVSNARHARSVGSGLFKWAAEAGRRYVKDTPYRNLPKLPKEHERTRYLKADEIKTLWHGLDRPDLPCSRSVALALKLQLCTMLRSGEILPATPGEIVGLGTPEAAIHVPLKRVKKRRIIVQPLSELAQEIIAEAIEIGKSKNSDFIFPGLIKGEPLKSLGDAVRSNKAAGKIGLLDFLGMERWTPHDLRRTAATLAGDLGCTDRDIARCLDHQKEGDQDAVASVTLGYNRSKRMPEKRQVLDAVAAGLRDIIGPPPVVRLKRAA